MDMPEINFQFVLTLYPWLLQSGLVDYPVIFPVGQGPFPLPDSFQFMLQVFGFGKQPVFLTL